MKELLRHWLFPELDDLRVEAALCDVMRSRMYEARLEAVGFRDLARTYHQQLYANGAFVALLSWEEKKTHGSGGG